MRNKNRDKCFLKIQYFVYQLSIEYLKISCDVIFNEKIEISCTTSLADRC